MIQTKTKMMMMMMMMMMAVRIANIEQQNHASSSEQSADNIPAPVRRDRSPEELAALELANLFRVPRVGGPGLIVKDYEVDGAAEDYGDYNGMDYAGYDDDEEDEDEDEDSEDEDAKDREWREDEVQRDVRLEVKFRLAAYDQLLELEKQHGVGRVPLTLTPLDDVYDVYCSEYMRHFCGDMDRNKEIELHAPDNLRFETDANGHRVWRKVERPEKLQGRLYLFNNVRRRFREFPTPEFASRDQVVKVTTEDGQHELGFKFLGGGYIEVEVTRDTIVAAIIGDEDTVHDFKIQNAPEVFTFIGKKGHY